MINWELIAIQLTVLLLTMIVLWSVRSFHKRNTRLKELQGRLDEIDAQKDVAAGSQRVGAMEDRLRVLERIVTEKGYDVATQIEALRDQRDVDERNSDIQLDFARKEEA